MSGDYARINYGNNTAVHRYPYKETAKPSKEESSIEEGMSLLLLILVASVETSRWKFYMPKPFF